MPNQKDAVLRCGSKTRFYDAVFKKSRLTPALTRSDYVAAPSTSTQARNTIARLHRRYKRMFELCA